MAILNIANPDQLQYNNMILDIEVLGGVRLEGLDRMRVTLKVGMCESEIPPIRHNLDLYNDTQLEKFIRKNAERFEIGTSTIAGTLAELTQLLENYRLEKLQDENQQTVLQSRPLTEQERAEAKAYLQQSNLIQRTIEDLQASGIQGEEENALILYLAMTSRKMQDPLSVVCLAKSGTGKSYLMERVALCIPPEDQKEHTQLTGNAFYYYKSETIRNKVFLIEDLAGAVDALFPIREIQSKKRISKTLTRKGRDGKLETITLVVEASISVIAVTTEESIYEDNANRSILIYLNDSKEQDERVMQYQRKKRAGMIDTYSEQQVQEKMQLVQRALEQVKVINPYAPYIDLPDNFPKKRRALPILLNFIEAITFYHQYQREPKTDETTGEVYIESTIEDIRNGYAFLQNVLLRRSDELNGAIRNFYENLVQVVPQLPPQESGVQPVKFKLQEIRQYIRLTPRSIQRYLTELVEYGYLHITGGKKRTGYEYEILHGTSQTELKQAIEKHIQQVIEKLPNGNSNATTTKTTKKNKT